jgi:hypothetical protein
MMMKANVGTVDRIARAVVGVLILAVGLYYQNWLGVIGIVPLATAAIGFCPAYLPLGLSTCKTENK